MACDPQTLMDEAKCLECKFTPGMLGYIQVQLLVDLLLALNPAADVTPESLIDRAKCWECKVAPGQVQYLIAELLCEIRDA